VSDRTPAGNRSADYYDNHSPGKKGPTNIKFPDICLRSVSIFIFIFYPSFYFVLIIRDLFSDKKV